MAALTVRDREVAAFLSLERQSGLGLRRIRALWERHGSGRAALAATRPGPPDPDPAAITVLREAGRLGLVGLPLGDSEYPRTLLDLEDPPPIVFVRGFPLPPVDHCVAIVGTRRATPYGRRMGARISAEMASRGWCVVSGMASGVDASAHEGALDIGGLTIGVLGSGHRYEYPPANRRLYARMRRAGWLYSEFVPAQRPFRGAFPRRNRIIAALARAVVVVEAGARSGALNTAGYGLKLGREVLAVPARAGEPKGAGTLGLLRDGAALATGAVDILDALGIVLPDAEATHPTGPAGADDWALSSLGGGERTVDGVASASARSVPEASAALGRLEIDGRVGRTPDGRYYPLHAAGTGTTPR